MSMFLTVAITALALVSADGMPFPSPAYSYPYSDPVCRVECLLPTHYYPMVPEITSSPCRNRNDRQPLVC